MKKMKEYVQFHKWQIGSGNPCFIIAEAGVNHNGRLDFAYKLVDAAGEAGVDAIKFQTFKSEKLVSKSASKAAYQIETTGNQDTQLEMLKQLELSFDQFRELSQYCSYKEILFLSTPFDFESADFLESIDIAAFKVSSGDLTNTPFLKHVAKKKRPILLSTGMSTLEEVDTAVKAIRETGNSELALFHCTSNYPTAPEDANLRAIQTLANTFLVPTGYSDHTQGIEIPIAAVAMGAAMIEKHFTLDRDLPGPDHRSSLEPFELRALVSGIRKIEAAMGDGKKIPVKSELNTASVARKSLVAAKDIPPDTILVDEHIDIKRPGTGLPPAMMEIILGRKSRVWIKAGDFIRLEDLG